MDQTFCCLDDQSEIAGILHCSIGKLSWLTEGLASDDRKMRQSRAGTQQAHYMHKKSSLSKAGAGTVGDRNK